MVLLLLSTIIIIPTLIGLGNLFLTFTGNQKVKISESILMGILSLSTLLTITAFFVPINSIIEIVIITAGLSNFIYKRCYIQLLKFPSTELIILSSASLIILFSGTFHPFILDHFGYYIPTIKWITEIGLVKGISNLDLTLGQMSAWHIFQSAFSHFSDPYLRINFILLIAYLVYIVEKKAWIHLCFFPIFLLFTQSPSPDLPVIIFSLIILNEILNNSKKTGFLFAFSMFVFTIKPTIIWLPMVSFLYSMLIVKSNFKNLIPGILVVLLFFTKNIWTFGYPIFPIALADIGVYWKPNPEVLKTSSQFAILKTYDMQYTYEEIQRFSQVDYIKNWLFLKGIKGKINIFLMISLLIFIIFTLIKKKRLIYLICISVLIKCFFILLFSAQYRFFIDVFFVIFFILFFHHLNQKKSLVTFYALSTIVLFFLSFPSFLQTYLPSFAVGNFMATFEKGQMYRPSTYDYTESESYTIGNLKFNVSKKYPYNFGTSIPAISESYLFDDVKAKIFPQLIDKQNIKKGFIWKALNPQEKKEADYMINSIKDSYQQQ